MDDEVIEVLPDGDEDGDGNAGLVDDEEAWGQ